MRVIHVQYRIRHGSYPDKLDDLVPDYIGISAVPLDPFTGQGLVYRKTPRGFLLYSLGEDLTDHGGTKLDSRGDPYEAGTDIPFSVER